ncbi:MAG: hypothetical protein LPK07_01910 [Hymenobacteraceae bacterium]|nr:hypothetical protein [Hymenobacteraceae bacterium]MDX5480417.1 hypothetical protein [Hymenobacteraceae bacterium]
MYDKALKGGKGTAFDHYNAACSWALAGNRDKAFAHLQKAIEKGYTSVNHFQEDSDLSSLHSDKRWPILVEDLKRSVAAIEANYNQPLKSKLESIYDADQQVRREFMAARQEHGAESAEVKQLIGQMQQTDAENQKEVIAIIESYGWPVRSMVGGKAQMAAFLVIQHAPLGVQEKYLPLMRKAAEEGEFEKRNLALLEDRVLVRNGQPQLYGTQISEEGGVSQVAPIADEANVDKRRAAVGLPPLAEYLKSYGIKYELPSATSKE